MEMIHSLAAKLSSTRKYFEIFRDAKINLALLGFGLETDGEPPVTDDETAIFRMLKSIRENGGNILITEIHRKESSVKMMRCIHVFSSACVFSLALLLYCSKGTFACRKNPLRQRYK